MSALLANLELQARTLIPEERSQLVDVLLESLRETPLVDIEREWNVEIEKRIAAYDKGEIASFAAADVFAEARRLGR
jgi:putative addiction module component (TIGR02574 family)